MRYDGRNLTVYVELDDATQYATVYDNTRGGGLPLATLQRARVYAPKGEPRWQLYNLSGTCIGKSFMPRSYQMLASWAERMLGRDTEEHRQRRREAERAMREEA